MMSMEKTKKVQSGTSILPWSLILLGVTSLIVPAVIFWNILPALINVSSQLEGKTVNIRTVLPFGLIIATFIAEIIIGFHLRRAQIKMAGLNRSQKNLALVTLLLGIIAAVAVVPMLITFVIQPIYSLTSGMK